MSKAIRQDAWTAGPADEPEGGRVPVPAEPSPPAPVSAQPPTPSPAEPSDAELVSAWRAGDGRALETLILRYQKPVYRLMLRSVRHPHDAEDLTQRAFCKAIDRIGGLRGGEAFRGWLFRIALNLAHNRRRDGRRWRMVSEDDAGPLPSADEDVDARLERAESLRRMQAEVGRLPRLQREVVRLRLHAELPFKEIAEVLGTSEASAKVSYHHAVRALRARMGVES